MHAEHCSLKLLAVVSILLTRIVLQAVPLVQVWDVPHARIQASMAQVDYSSKTIVLQSKQDCYGTSIPILLYQTDFWYKLVQKHILKA